MNRTITPQKIVTHTINILAVSLAFFLVYYAWSFPIPQTRFANIFFGVSVLIYYLIVVKGNLGESDDTGYMGQDLSHPNEWVFRGKMALALVSGILILLCSIYVELNFERLLHDAQIYGYETMDYVVGGIVIAIAIDSSRRAFGNAYGGFAVASVLYAYLGPWLPGILYFTGMDTPQVIRYGAIGLQGVYGYILELGATWIAMFILLAGLGKEFGLMDFVVDIGNQISRVFKSGVIHTAIIGSALMASLTGSAAANTATTGSFTIPLMIEQEIEPKIAAAIEGAASSGGQMMPPIMGVAAFLMADLLGISYFSVVVAAVLPALFYFISIAIISHMIVVKNGWTTDTSKDPEWRALLSGIHFAIPVVVLLYTLGPLQYSPLSAGLYTIAALLITYLGKEVVSSGSPKEIVITILKGFRTGITDMAALMTILASIGLIINIIVQTGLAQKISAQLIAIAGGALIPLLILAMIASILFGMGLPAPAAYVLVVTLSAPPLIAAGVPDIAAHLFVFYFAMLSTITPPVATAVAVGSRIANTDFIRTGVVTMGVAFPAFLIPFVFVRHESMILHSFPHTIVATITVILCLILLSFGLAGYNSNRELTRPTRGFFVVVAIAGLFASPDVLHYAISAGIFLYLVYLTRSKELIIPTVHNRIKRYL